MPIRIAKLMLYYVLLAFVVVIGYAALSGHAQAAETAVTASQGLQGALVDIIQQVSGSVKEGVNFLQQEIPEVIKQLLVWKLVEALFWATTQLMLGLLGIYLILRGVGAIKRQIELDSLTEAAKSLLNKTNSRSEEHPAIEAAYKKADGEFEAQFPNMILWIVSGLIGIVFLLVFIFNIWDNILIALKIYIAPKVWLIEYAASLVK